MPTIKSFEDLEIWQVAIRFVTKIYCLTRKFPKEELYGLTSQIRRAAISIGSNSSEGFDRRSDKEFSNFLRNCPKDKWPYELFKKIILKIIKYVRVFISIGRLEDW